MERVYDWRSRSTEKRKKYVQGTDEKKVLEAMRRTLRVAMIIRQGSWCYCFEGTGIQKGLFVVSRAML